MLLLCKDVHRSPDTSMFTVHTEPFCPSFGACDVLHSSCYCLGQQFPKNQRQLVIACTAGEIVCPPPWEARFAMSVVVQNSTNFGVTHIAISLWESPPGLCKWSWLSPGQLPYSLCRQVKNKKARHRQPLVDVEAMESNAGIGISSLDGVVFTCLQN